MSNIAFVVQRYGTEIIGGAETYCRQLAEKLASDLQWNITVYTTTARDHMTWKNFYASNQEQLNRVKIMRFPSIARRRRYVFAIFNLLMKFLWFITRRFDFMSAVALPFEHIWFRLQGPWSPQLLQALRSDIEKYDKVFFMTYLYYPTVFGLQIAGDRAILIPTAHDEAPFYSHLVKRVLDSAPKVLALTEAEESLIRSNLSRESLHKASYLGYGLDIASFGSRDKNAPKYLFYLGRISRGKGIDVLIRNFLAALDDERLNLELYLAGAIDPDFDVPDHDSIKIIGRVSDEQKTQLIVNSLAVVNPSAHESLSMIIVEAMLLGRPAIVNTESEVLKFYAGRTDTVLGFNSSESFRRAVVQIYSESIDRALDLESRLLQTQKWAKNRFSWDSILAKLSELVNAS